MNCYEDKKMELFLNKIVDKNKIMGIIKIREVINHLCSRPLKRR